MTALFVAPDGYGDLTIWRRDSDDDRLPQPILARTAANARGFEELAALVEGAAQLSEAWHQGYQAAEHNARVDCSQPLNPYGERAAS